MSGAATIADLLRGACLVETRSPWPRAIVRVESWRAMLEELVAGRATLVSLWGEMDFVHAAVSKDGAMCVLTLECTTGRFPSLGVAHAPAIRLERSIRDLFGLEPEGAVDTRPWLDHGRWDAGRPKNGLRTETTQRYDFLPVEGEGLHVIPVGPVHAGIIEPGHFRFTANGEAVVRLEERLGYAHKGIASLMEGRSVESALKLAGRASGDSTVAYALAFSRAVEAATGSQIPARAHFIRAIMAELERLANHCGDIGAVCNDATFTIMHAQCGILREQALRAADACFGHRLMMDRVVPGGVASDLFANGVPVLRGLIETFKTRFPKLIALYDRAASLQDRTVATGHVGNALVTRFGCGGFVGRASGRAFDARKAYPYPPYDALEFDVPVFAEGDVNARVWVRIREVEQSLHLLTQLIHRMPEGPIAATLALQDARACEGAALVESFRGDVFAWVRLTPEGAISRCHLRDPSWFQWPLLEAAIEGNIVADFPLCNKSFNCSYSGHDL